MPAANPAREVWADRGFFFAAVLVIFTWFMVVWRFAPDGICDERVHMVDIAFFHSGQPGWPEEMPMTPGYHFLGVVAKKLLPTIRSTSQGRLVTFGMTMLGFAGFALLWRHVHGRPAGRAVLLLALYPLFLPYSTLVYTDVPALALVLCATWAQFTGHRVVAILALIGAVAIRQTYLAWAGFLIAWEIFRPDAPRREVLRRCLWLLLLLASAVAVVLVVGRLTPGTRPSNHLRPNPGILHIAALILLLFGLPVWLRRLPEAAQWLRGAVRAAPRKALALLLVALALAVGLTLTYDNFHPWNRVLVWGSTRPAPSFSSLTSWPLVGMERYVALRFLLSLNVVVMAGVLILIFSRQPRRLELCLVAGFGLTIALTNSLVEPRYLLPTAVFLLLFLEIPWRDARLLIPWWSAVAIIYAPFIVNLYSLW